MHLASIVSIGGFIYVSITGQSAAQARHATVPVTKASVWEAVCKGVSPQVLSNFLVLGLPGGVMMAADACSFDVTTVMASILGETFVLHHRPPLSLKQTPRHSLCAKCLLLCDSIAHGQPYGTTCADEVGSLLL